LQAPNRINLQAFNAHLGKQALNLTNGTVLLASPDEAAVAGFTELATSILSSIAGRELEPKSDFTGEGVSILPAGILPPIGKILHEEDQGGATAIAFENGVECIVSDEETQSGLPPGASLGCVLVMERDGGLAEVYHRNPDKFESAYVAGHLARGALLNNLSSLSIIFHETSIALFSIARSSLCTFTGRLCSVSDPQILFLQPSGCSRVLLCAFLRSPPSSAALAIHWPA
jgi:hypothetical protein